MTGPATVRDLGAAVGELARILRDDALARPQRQGAKRDPSPVWDTWYEEFSSTDRRRLAPFMGGAVAPDVLASNLGLTVDAAMWQWRSSCLAELKSLAYDPLFDDYAAAEAAADDEADAELLGPQELASFYGVSAQLIAQWRRRGKLPPAWRVVSGVPLWRFGDIRHHEISKAGR